MSPHGYCFYLGAFNILSAIFPFCSSSQMRYMGRYGGSVGKWCRLHSEMFLDFHYLPLSFSVSVYPCLCFTEKQNVSLLASDMWEEGRIQSYNFMQQRKEGATGAERLGQYSQRFEFNHCFLLWSPHPISQSTAQPPVALTWPGSHLGKTSPRDFWHLTPWEAMTVIWEFNRTPKGGLAMQLSVFHVAI